MSTPVDSQGPPQAFRVSSLPRGPFVLLGLMTLATTGGPFLMRYSLGGGASPDWPPDRPSEWGVAIGTSVTVLALMLACVSLGLRTKRTLARAGRGRSVIAPVAREVRS